VIEEERKSVIERKTDALREENKEK